MSFWSKISAGIMLFSTGYEIIVWLLKASMLACVHEHIYICLSACMFVCMHIYVHTYMHIHKHTHFETTFACLQNYAWDFSNTVKECGFSLYLEIAKNNQK